MARLPKGMDFSAYSSPSFKFWYDEKWYTAQGAETLFRIATKDDMAVLRAEYTRMRDVAQKRVARLQKQFPDSRGAQYRYNTGKVDKNGNPIYKPGFQKLSNIDPRDLPKAFSELAKFIKAKGSTVSGQREIKAKTIKTWQDQGLNLNEKNYDKTIKILEGMRKQKLLYGSDKAVDLADSMVGLDDQQTNKWLDHLDTLLLHTQELDLWKDVMESRGEEVDIDDLIQQLGW